MLSRDSFLFCCGIQDAFGRVATAATMRHHDSRMLCSGCGNAEFTIDTSSRSMAYRGKPRHMLQMHLMRQACIMIQTRASIAALVFMMVVGHRANAQADTTSAGIPTGELPISESVRRSGSLILFAGIQQGIEPGPDPELGMLVGIAPTISLGDKWELSPEVSLWYTEAYEKKKWYLKVTLPVRWYALDHHRLAVYAVAGPGILFSAPWVTIDIGGGVCYSFFRSLTLTAELRSYLHDRAGGTNASILSASPLSFTLGARFTPVK